MWVRREVFIPLMADQNTVSRQPGCTQVAPARLETTHSAPASSGMTAQRAHLWVVLLVASTAVAAPTEQKPTEVQDSAASPSAAPLITDSANKGFRMPGLYGFGTKPFYLERDPETGAFDFSAAAGGSSQKYSSKVPAHADYDYEEVAIDTDPIDRKDTLGPVRPNDLGEFLQKPSKTPQVPLISSSYASTKLQGMGVSSKQEPTSTTTSPSYYSQWPIKSTTEVLDFWPPQKPTTEATPEYYDYEEVSAEVSETQPPSPSPSPPATTLPPFTYEPYSEEAETVRPIPPKKKQEVVKKPELPISALAPEIELLPPVEEEIEPEIEFRPQESEIKVPEQEMRPPHVDFRPAELPDRPSLVDFRPAELPVRPPQEFRPPHQPSVRPLETEMRPPLETPFRPPQGVPLPPRYEPERPQLDTQGWKQAQTPPPVAPPSISSTRVRFPEVTPTTPVPFRQNLPQLPQGYEPIRPPPPHFRIPNRPPHPGRRPPPPDSPYAFVEAKPIDRIHYESRPHPPPPHFRYRPYLNKQAGVRNRNDDQPHSVPSNLPNILPQFRPNANLDPDKFMGFRQPPPPPPAKRLQPPAGPLVGRRVGSEVSTLQMMKGAVSRPPPRDDAPHPQPPPPPSMIDSRPLGPADRADGPGVFVVYANSKNNDVHVGSRGPQRPLPPNRLLQERPILPGKSDFPYALEKPVEPTNLQDAPPPAIKNPSSYPGATPTVSTVVRPHSVGSEFTVSAVMHAGPGGAGHQGQVFVVAPQHRPETASSKISNDVITGTHHHSHHHKDASESGTPPPEPFLAPFHASTNVAAPAPGNGWLALRDSEIRTKGIVERADIDVSEPAQETSRFDIENFSPQLIGGFQPIMPEEPAAPKTADEPQEKKVEMQTADRQE